MGLAPPIFPTIGELWKIQDEKRILRMKNNLKSTKEKTEMSIFALHTRRKRGRLGMDPVL